MIPGISITKQELHVTHSLMSNFHYISTTGTAISSKHVWNFVFLANSILIQFCWVFIQKLIMQEAVSRNMILFDVFTVCKWSSINMLSTCKLHLHVSSICHNILKFSIADKKQASNIGQMSMQIFHSVRAKFPLILSSLQVMQYESGAYREQNKIYSK